jgi:hypothetical protein
MPADDRDLGKIAVSVYVGVTKKKPASRVCG